MAKRIYIGSYVIDFPTSGTDANWAPAVDLFAQAVEEFLNGLASLYDVSPRTQTLNDITVETKLDKCIFDPSVLRGFTFNYVIYRYNSSTHLTESGIVNGVYNDNTLAWDLEHQFSGERQAPSGDVYHLFTMDNDNVLNITPQGLTNPIGKISYSAKTFTKE
jgi:hypothetical protein